MRWLPMMLLLLWILPWGCDQRRERSMRIAVRSLAAAPKDRAAGELAKVVAYGFDALGDIEQEYQGADYTGRVRLIQALQHIGRQEAVPFLKFVARWGEEEELRQKAKQALESMQRVK